MLSLNLLVPVPVSRSAAAVVRHTSGGFFGEGPAGETTPEANKWRAGTRNTGEASRAEWPRLFSGMCEVHLPCKYCSTVNIVPSIGPGRIYRRAKEGERRRSEQENGGEA